MTQRDLFEKIQSGEPLDARESLFLEQTLEEQHGKGVAEAVSQLGDPELSMAWRSDLNQKLKAIAPKPKARRWSWLVPGMAAGAVAAGMALFAMFGTITTDVAEPMATENVAPPTRVVESTPLSRKPKNFEGALIQAHLADEVEVTGGVYSPRSVAESGYDWSSL